MPNQQFTLIVEGADLRSRAVFDALFEAGCDDATVGSIDDTHYIDFDRDAASLGEAILSAIRDVEKVEGVHVTEIVDLEPAPLTGNAARTPHTPENFGLLVVAVPQPGGLPDPATVPSTVYGLRRSSNVAPHFRPSPENRERQTTTSFPGSAPAWNDITIRPSAPLRRVGLR